jgi:hypothetical protein
VLVLVSGVCAAGLSGAWADGWWRRHDPHRQPPGAGFGEACGGLGGGVGGEEGEGDGEVCVPAVGVVSGEQGAHGSGGPVGAQGVRHGCEAVELLVGAGHRGCQVQSLIHFTSPKRRSWTW